MEAGDRIVITGEHPDNGKAYQIKEIRENDWILTTNNRLFHKDFFELYPLSNLTSAQEWAQVSHLEESSPEVLNSSDSARLTSIAQISYQSDSQVLPTTETCDRCPLEKLDDSGRSTSSQLHHPVSRLVCKENDSEPMTQETAYLPSTEPSCQSVPGSSVSKTSQDSLTVGKNPTAIGSISSIFSISFPKSGTMRNGFVYRQDTLAAPLLEKDCFWLESPGALSSGQGRPPGQSRLEGQLKKLGVLERREVLNPQYLEKAYSLPLGWTDPQECRPATELLAIEGKPSAMHLTPESPVLPSDGFSTSIRLSQEVMMTQPIEFLPIAQIRRDGGTQPRAAINHLTISEYAEDMQEGDRFPAVLVFYDGTDYWLADGFHRVLAAESIGLAEMAVEIRQGTRRDAILYSVGANAKHGLRRTNTDKRRVVTTLLEDEEWSQYSNNQIAKLCCVSLDLVNRLRKSLNESLSERTYITKHGTVSTMNTANIGRKSLSHTSPQSIIDDEVSTEAGLSESFLDGQTTFEVQHMTISSPVIVIGEHPRSGQTGRVTVIPNPDAAIILFEDEQRELIRLEFLSPVVTDDSNRTTQVTDTHHTVMIKEGLNYRAGNGCEWYVRVEQSTWEKLLEYQAHVGTATLDSAIKRLLEMASVREDIGL